MTDPSPIPPLGQDLSGLPIEEQVQALHEEGNARAAWWSRSALELATTAGARAGARTARRMSVLVLAVMVAGLSLVAGYSFLVAQDAAETARNLDTVSSNQELLRQTAEDARAQGEAANAELRELGQPQVAQADPSSDPADALVQATTASVLASLARNTDEPLATLSAAEIGQAVADAVATAQLRPDPLSVAQAVAEYFTQNPVPTGAAGPTGPSGPPGAPCDATVIPACRGAAGADGGPGADGATGPQGPPPTADEIVAAFRQAVADNPQLLCPTGGTYQQVQLVLADGTRPAWLCVGDAQTVPPATTDPVPTTDAPPTTTVAPSSTAELTPLLPLPSS